MKSMKGWTVTTLCATAMLLTIACATHTALAGGDHCFYHGTMFSDGAANCQAGRQYRCDDGDWRAQGLACTSDDVKTSQACTWDGIAFSTGSASCQAGTQYRCEDGAWRRLGQPCTVGDSPIKIVPEGRTCMFEGATVSSGSTICRSGATYLCNDGDWSNLGTACR